MKYSRHGKYRMTDILRTRQCFIRVNKTLYVASTDRDGQGRGFG